jgi:hypothetical protein
MFRKGLCQLHFSLEILPLVTEWLNTYIGLFKLSGLKFFEKRLLLSLFFQSIWSSFLLTSSQCSTFPLTAQDTMELTSILHQQEVAIFFLTQEVPAATGYWILTSSKHKQAMGTDLSLSFFL